MLIFISWKCILIIIYHHKRRNRCICKMKPAWMPAVKHTRDWQLQSKLASCIFICLCWHLKSCNPNQCENGLKATLVSQLCRVQPNKKQGAIKMLGDRINSHSHTPAANHVWEPDIDANPKEWRTKELLLAEGEIKHTINGTLWSWRKEN